jgi:putative sigma-54 modulation protein
MIEKMEINSIHTDVSEDLNKYINKKIGKLEKYIPKHARESVHVEVKLKEASIKKKKQYTCEVIMHLPKDNITISETTLNMFAAVDIVEAKLKNQIKKYAEKHGTRGLHKKVLAKLRNKI